MLHLLNENIEFDPVISPYIRIILDHVKYSWNVSVHLSSLND